MLHHARNAVLFQPVIQALRHRYAAVLSACAADGHHQLIFSFLLKLAMLATVKATVNKWL